MESGMTLRDQFHLPMDRLENRFDDFKAALSEVEAVTEANRCINCYGAPCIQACPTSINIPQFISRIANGNTAGAARTILDSNIMGLSCARSCPTEVLCEGACVYHSLDRKPILIGKLQRFAVEHAYEKNLSFYASGKPTGKRVALVGAGPASLACAHELRKQGHEAVIFEKGKLPGGLNTHGIAPYKMRAQTSIREIEEIVKMGVKFVYERELGKNLSLDELIRDFDAVFLGMGLGPDSKFDAPGAQLPHVQGAVDFIGRVKTLPTAKLADLVEETRTALVIGGGNTAIDACRELRGLGINRVCVSYRRGEADMSGYAHELKCARQEGVEFLFHTLPTAFEGDSVTLTRTAVSESGKVELLSEKIKLSAQLVLVATGQSKLDALLKAVPGLKFDKGRLLADPSTGRTGNPKIFAAGDLVNGGKEVVNAVAEGKVAARGMNEVLHG